MALSPLDARSSLTVWVQAECVDVLGWDTFRLHSFGRSDTPAFARCTAVLQVSNS
jgi:hypothetical protein